jgi:hypothetical protein
MRSTFFIAHGTAIFARVIVMAAPSYGEASR